MIKVKAIVEVKPTEDVEKVKRALLNLMTPEKIEIESRGEGQFIVAEGSGVESLLKLHESLKKRRILTAARNVMKQSVTGTNMTIYLNKQAAYMGHASFCQREGESPLGPITIEVMCDSEEEINELIDKLTL
ncbi:MAG: hypothetical protein NDF52_04900 [archaeon YNP-WB-062]|jgi:predicted RNA binding protein with dsRBD fold (UPF0201 family)|nr:hypothetical protein [Candidatus Culexarchaeum yellowstonense]